MAIEVEMSDDITKYETKTFGPFTTRQAIGVGIALTIGFILLLIIPGDFFTKIIIISILVSPVATSGFVTLDHTTLEMFLARIVVTQFLTNPKRKYISVNIHEEKIKKIKKEREIELLKKMTKEERANYENKTNEKKIEYSENPKYMLAN